MRIITHLTFNGQCEAAFRLYAACLEGEIALLMHHGESGQECSAEMEGKVFHATLRVGEGVLTGLDHSGENYRRPQGFAVQLNLTDTRKAEAIYAALREAGVVHFPLQATSWAEAYCVLTDRFGTPWEINCGPGAS